MSADKRKRLAAFHNWLRDEKLVVGVRPGPPPGARCVQQGGFALRPRLLEDGDLMFRVNEHTTLTDEGREVLGAARITAARVTHTARATEIDSAETEATA